MIVDSDSFWRAVEAKDPRFDGWVFCGVRTTGIYCRPSCPARTPKRENVRFFTTAAAAQAAGFRACKRCRPDATPGSPDWDRRADLVGRAMRLIADGVVDREGVVGLARRLGYSERHLHRQLVTVVGAGPLALARAQRAQTARILLETTGVSIIEVAFAAGFRSVRQFNATIQEIFATTPREVRARARRGGRAADSGAVVLRLPHRTPLDAEGLLAFLALRAVPGVEEALDGAYRRSLRLPHGGGIVELRPLDGHVQARYWLDDLRDLAAAMQRSRALLDLDSDPHAVSQALGRDPLLGPLVRAAPGRRVPGHVDGHELAVRAVLGQQVSLAGAATLAARLVSDYGQAARASAGGGHPCLSLRRGARRGGPRSACDAGVPQARAARTDRGAREGRSDARRGRRSRAGAAADCWRCPGSGRGPPTTSRCARCAIPTPSCPAISAFATRSNGSSRMAGPSPPSGSRSAGGHIAPMPFSISGRCSPHRGRPSATQPTRAKPNGSPPERSLMFTTSTTPLYTTIDSPIGELLLLGDGRRLHGLYMQGARKPMRIAPGWGRAPAAFAAVSEQLDQYFAGHRTSFDVPLAMDGTPFQLRVWGALRDIGYGETISYGELARRVGQPSAARAVGLANGCNPISVIVPCHRVIGADGALTGYGGGIERKRLLLELEANARVPQLPSMRRLSSPGRPLTKIARVAASTGPRITSPSTRPGSASSL